MPHNASADQGRQLSGERDSNHSLGTSLFPGYPRLGGQRYQSERMTMDNLTIHRLVRNRKERMGRSANRRLNSFAESIVVNVGGCPETDVPSSRGEKHGQRRRRHSSPRLGKPATWRRTLEASPPGKY